MSFKTAKSNYKGLLNFISEIRNCKTPDKETKRINKELAKIRAAFSKKRGLDSYSKRKYLQKIIYIYMLGYSPNFGHVEAVNLIASDKFLEKQAGYMCLSVLFIEHNDLLRLCIHSLKKDLNSRNQFFCSLALTTVANVGENEMAESLSVDVCGIVSNVKLFGNVYVRNKAHLCLLRLFRRFPDIIQNDEKFIMTIHKMFETAPIDVLQSLTSLICGIVKRQSDGWESTVPLAIRQLHRLAISRDCPRGFFYHSTPLPWVQYNILRLLQLFPSSNAIRINENPNLHKILSQIISKTNVTKNSARNNIEHSILFEAFNLIIYMSLEKQHPLLSEVLTKLSNYMSIRTLNIRYLALETMSKIAKLPGTIDQISQYHDCVKLSLKNNDISLRRRALDLMFVICVESNQKEIICGLCDFLENEQSIKDEIALKIAILVDKQASKTSYVDFMLYLIEVAGDFVTSDILFRLIQIVTNDEDQDLQKYAADSVLKKLKVPDIHEKMVRVGGYILGEFGQLVEDESILDQFASLNKHFVLVSTETKCTLFSAYMKMANMEPNLVSIVKEIFDKYRASVDSELQQRACEYWKMIEGSNEELMDVVWESMPTFEEDVVFGSGHSSLEADAKKNIDSDPRFNDKSKGESDFSSLEETGSNNFSSPDSKNKETLDAKQSEPDKMNIQTTSKLQNKENLKQDLLSTTPQLLDLDSLIVVDKNTNASTSSSIDDLFSSLVMNKSVEDQSSPDDVFVAPTNTIKLTQNTSLIGNLVQKSNGVLFESELIQIGFRMRIENGNICKLILYYGNHHPTESLVNLRCSLVESSTVGLNIQYRPQNEFEVASKKQIPQHFMIHFVRPFKSYPELKIEWECNKQSYILPLKLPILMIKFVKPLDCSFKDYYTKQVALDTGSNQQTEFTFKARQQIKECGSKELVQIFEDMNMNVQPSSKQFPIDLAIGFQCCSAEKNLIIDEQESQSVLMRLELNVNNGEIRFIVRSKNEIVTSAVAYGIEQMFGDL